jgi:hypothetical protein
MPTDRTTQVLSARSRFFHQGRSTPLWTSSASNTAWMPLEASHPKTMVASGATAPPFHLATCPSSAAIQSRTAGGVEPRIVVARSPRVTAMRATTSPPTAARGSREKKSQKAICAASPNDRDLLIPHQMSFAQSRTTCGVRRFFACWPIQYLDTGPLPDRIVLNVGMAPLRYLPIGPTYWSTASLTSAPRPPSLSLRLPPPCPLSTASLTFAPRPPSLSPGLRPPCPRARASCRLFRPSLFSLDPIVGSIWKSARHVRAPFTAPRTKLQVGGRTSDKVQVEALATSVRVPDAP